MKKVNKFWVFIVILCQTNILFGRYSTFVKNNSNETVVVVSRRLGCDHTNAEYPVPISTSICHSERLAPGNTTGDDLKGSLVAQSPYILNVKHGDKWYYALAWKSSEDRVFQFPGDFQEGTGGYALS